MNEVINILKQINLSDEYTIFFKEANFKIDSNKNIYLEVLSLPLDVYQELNNKFSLFLNEDIKVNIIKQDNTYFNEYLEYFFDNRKIAEKIYFDRCKLDEDLKISVINAFEEKKVNGFKKDLELFLKKCGFDINIIVKYDEALKEGIYEEIRIDSVDISEIKNKVKEKAKIEKKKKDESIIKGYLIKDKPSPIKSLLIEEDRVVTAGKIFKYDDFTPRDADYKIVTLSITDKTDSIYLKIFERDLAIVDKLKELSKKNAYILVQGKTKNDRYSNDELVLNVTSINLSEENKEEKQLLDNADIKRVELHTHTNMSMLDGVASGAEIIKYATKFGHKAIAITDHDGCQSFPEIFKAVNNYNKGKEAKDKFKVLYGSEMTLVEDSIKIAYNEKDYSLLNDSFVVFDTETTGFNAGGSDQMIEIGAVRIRKGEIIDSFNELIYPGRYLPKKITELTGISDEMLLGKRSEEEVTKAFLEYVGNDPLVAHNAKFDISFLNSACVKYNLGELSNTVLDTLAISQLLNTENKRHSLSVLVKKYEVEFDEDSHHRADYDAKATAVVFHRMCQQMAGFDILRVQDLKKLIDPNTIHQYGRDYHVNLIAVNKTGLKNLYKLISLGNTKYLYKGSARILRSLLQEYREGLLVGSGCYLSEMFVEGRAKTENELVDIANFYDYVEVQPLEVYDHLLQTGEFSSSKELREHIQKIVNATKAAGKIIVATGDVHHLRVEDKIYREILINQKVPGGGRHPLARKNITTIPSQHLRTTEDMLNSFTFLGEDLAFEMVVENTNKIADLAEEIEVIPQTGGVPFSPKIENADKIVSDMVYERARSIYGEKLPAFIDERIQNELKGIIGGGFDVIYLIAQKLVKKSNDDGYVVGSRGSVGSSFVATMMGITEVNPLPAHYVCTKCKYSEFKDDDKDYSFDYSSGYDLPDKNCPKCGVKLNKEGQDIPFATFLGFNVDKVPDIDLNFSGEYQWKAHEYTKELFGLDNVYKAGTISTVAQKTAFGYVKAYAEEKGKYIKTAEVERLASHIEGVKRSTGQHPGGIVVIPDYKEVADFTPFQYPAGDKEALWRTTHFDYHAIDECVLKLDILGHDNPTILRMLQDLSGIDVKEIPFDDKKVISLLSSPSALGLNEKELGVATGTMGLPELGTRFVIDMLNQTKPQSFGELVKIAGLSHGTDVWQGNASELIAKNIVPFKDIIGCRDDIMVNLIKCGVMQNDAFEIMEFVRKGKASSNLEKWAEFSKIMKEHNVPDWFIDSCFKIKYMFPKAHAAAYVMSAMRIAWFKVYKPLYFYSTYFSVRENDFDVPAMIGGIDTINKKINELVEKGFDATDKEKNILNNLYIAKEAVLRGIKFQNIDLEKSDAKNFICNEEENALILPFRSLDGLGLVAAETIVKAREKRFLSVEDLCSRGKVSKTIAEKMKELKIIDKLPETNQLTLF